MSGRRSLETQIRPAVIGRRAAPRLRLSLPGRLQTMYDTRRCIVLDLSETGAQIGLEKPLRPGEGAILQVVDLDHFGTIVRHGEGANGGVNGIEFDSPLSKSDVLAVRHFAETFEERERLALRQEAQAWVAGVG